MIMLPNVAKCVINTFIITREKFSNEQIDISTQLVSSEGTQCLGWGENEYKSCVNCGRSGLVWWILA